MKMKKSTLDEYSYLVFYSVQIPLQTGVSEAKLAATQRRQAHLGCGDLSAAAGNV